MSSDEVEFEDHDMILTVEVGGDFYISESVLAALDDAAKIRLNRAFQTIFQRLQTSLYVSGAKPQLYKLDEFGNLTATSLGQAQPHIVIEGNERTELTPVALEIVKMCNKPGRVPISYKEAAERAAQTFRLTTLLARYRAWRNS